MYVLNTLFAEFEYISPKNLERNPLDMKYLIYYDARNKCNPMGDNSTSWDLNVDQCDLNTCILIDHKETRLKQTETA